MTFDRYLVSGDDGKYSEGGSSHFVITAVFIPLDSWEDYLEKVTKVRKGISQKYKIPLLREELHTRDFLLGKLKLKKHHNQKLKFPDVRLKLLKEFCLEISSSFSNDYIRTVTVVVDKASTKYKNKNPVDLVEDVFNFCLRTISWNLRKMSNPDSTPKLLVACDNGREGIYKKVVRKLRKCAPRFKKGKGRINEPLNFIVEDCITKNSKDCYFVQLSDLLAYFFFLYFTQENWSNKIVQRINIDDIQEIFESLKLLFNTEYTKEFSVIALK